MVLGSQDYKDSVLDDLYDSSDLGTTKHAYFIERFLIRNASPEKLHPNPKDEFSNPSIGPSDAIVTRYKKLFATVSLESEMMEPIVVAKLSTGGYRILNGHHRWLAAKSLRIKSVPIQIVNVISDDQIMETLNKLNGEMCVSFDLDEVLICDPNKYPADKLPFPLNTLFPEVIRKNAGLLISTLQDAGFDVWVYTGKYYTDQYVKSMLSLHGGRVSGVISGVKSNALNPQLRESFRKKYRIAVHIDNESIIWIDTQKKEYEIIDVKSDKHWANKVSMLIKKQLGIESEWAVNSADE